jgi:hypothetical protein
MFKDNSFRQAKFHVMCINWLKGKLCSQPDLKDSFFVADMERVIASANRALPHSTNKLQDMLLFLEKLQDARGQKIMEFSYEIGNCCYPSKKFTFSLTVSDLQKLFIASEKGKEFLIAFLMGMHPRLGAQSLVAWLDQCVACMIASVFLENVYIVPPESVI